MMWFQRVSADATGALSLAWPFTRYAEVWLAGSYRLAEGDCVHLPAAPHSVMSFIWKWAAVGGSIYTMEIAQQTRAFLPRELVAKCVPGYTAMSLMR